MNESARWLSERLDDAPAELRKRMLAALAEQPEHDAIYEQLAEAALVCAQRALREPGARASAVDLLAADALMTHACEAASEQGHAVLSAFTAQWDATRLNLILEARVE